MGFWYGAKYLSLTCKTEDSRTQITQLACTETWVHFVAAYSSPLLFNTAFTFCFTATQNAFHSGLWQFDDMNFFLAGIIFHYLLVSHLKQWQLICFASCCLDLSHIFSKNVVSNFSVFSLEIIELWNRREGKERGEGRQDKKKALIPYENLKPSCSSYFSPKSNRSGKIRAGVGSKTLYFLGKEWRNVNTYKFLVFLYFFIFIIFAEHAIKLLKNHRITVIFGSASAGAVTCLFEVYSFW